MTIPAADRSSSISTKGSQVGGHTPGPWLVGTVTDGHGTVIHGEAYVHSQNAILEVRVDSPRPVADGRLIAAAPDLLEAAKRALAWADALFPYSEPGSELVADLECLRAAIAKATGG